MAPATTRRSGNRPESQARTDGRGAPRPASERASASSAAVSAASGSSPRRSATNAVATAGWNWVPMFARSRRGRPPRTAGRERYARSLVIASKLSATSGMRGERLVGRVDPVVAVPVEALVVVLDRARLVPPRSGSAAGAAPRAAGGASSPPTPPRRARRLARSDRRVDEILPRSCSRAPSAGGRRWPPAGGARRASSLDVASDPVGVAEGGAGRARRRRWRRSRGARRLAAKRPAARVRGTRRRRAGRAQSRSRGGRPRRRRG